MLSGVIERESTGRLIDAYDGHLIMPVEVPAEISVRHSAVGARKRTDVVLEDYGTSYVNGQSGANDSVLMAGTDSSFNHGQSQSERQAKKRRLDGICKGIDSGSYCTRLRQSGLTFQTTKTISIVWWRTWQQYYHRTPPSSHWQHWEASA